MARATGTKDYSSLAGGLLTEASEIAFPDGYTSDELNFLLDSAGIRRVKRKGIEIVRGGASRTYSRLNTNLDTTLSAVEYWEAPNLLVLAMRLPPSGTVGPNNRSLTALEFRDPDTLALVGAFTPFQSDDSEIGSTSIATLNNFAAVVASTGVSQFVLEYDEGLRQVTVRSFTGYLRDFELVDDGLTVSERPTTLTNEHNYNLLNAGWYAQRKTENDTFGSPLTKWRADGSNADYPSNGDIPSLGVGTDADGNPNFERDNILETVTGNTPAPRGHYIYALNDTNRAARVTDPDNDGAPSTTLGAVLGRFTVG